MGINMKDDTTQVVVGAAVGAAAGVGVYELVCWIVRSIKARWFTKKPAAVAPAAVAPAATTEVKG